MTDLIVGDTIEWTEPVFGPYRRGWGGRRSCQNTPLDERTIAGVIERESYGQETGQHTFSIRVTAASGYEAPAVGSVILRKGRNLYGRLTSHEAAADADRHTRAALKHLRGGHARELREERIGL